MSPRPLRARLLDLAVASVCVACVGAPLMGVGFAANPDPSVVESGGTVDQKVLQSGIISNPLNGSFGGARSGKVDGSIQWDVYSTASDGMKLVVMSDGAPAMRDAKNGVDVPDYGASPSEWAVGSNDRRFGFSVVGGLGLSRFEDGKKWRGFNGKRPVEIGRRANAIPVTRTTVKLRAEFAKGLADDARPTANVRAIAVLNL
ncbi:MAG: hypothetical protein JWM98_9 [Thermoleophilia bacterium]|nr:hypothetical protein [Thermoleophilia bacterium]